MLLLDVPSREEGRTRMTLATVRSYPRGPRLWVLGQRIHHGGVGCALIGAALARPRLRGLAVVGAALALHDRADWRVWFARELLPASVTDRTELALDTAASTCNASTIPST